MGKVIAFGVFDGLHEGHRFFLEQAKELAKKNTFPSLTVIVARDETVWRLKGKVATFSEQERVNALRDLRIADKVLLGVDIDGENKKDTQAEKKDPLSFLYSENPDWIALGYDQDSPLTHKIPAEFRERIVRIPAFFPHKFKSSIIFA